MSNMPKPNKQTYQASGGVEIWRVNAFTDTPFTGNPAGVVPHADGLSEDLMQKIAGELNNISETVFISTPQDPKADIRLRYFTTTTEVDLCGHATIAALFTLAWSGKLSGDNETRTLIAETPVGLLELRVTFADGELQWATMEQLVPQTTSPTQPQLAAQVLGLPADAMAQAPAIGCCTSGIWACFAPVKDLAALAAIQIQRDLIEQLWPENDELTGIYAFTFLDTPTTPQVTPSEKQLYTQGRFFSPPKYGIVEDPVTGTASGALGGYLIEQGYMMRGDHLFARQGVEMGRGGLVRVQQNANGCMSISGQAVPIFKGRLLI
ncbi:MAG: PhzF family phenazine biosynthesis protein [Caldilineaceae bacterium]|nr:PhzF family phenazine biosynthesis protein [Caldilineaceae bacterium]